MAINIFYEHQLNILNLNNTYHGISSEHNCLSSIASTYYSIFYNTGDRNRNRMLGGEK